MFKSVNRQTDACTDADSSLILLGHLVSLWLRLAKKYKISDKESALQCSWWSIGLNQCIDTLIQV